MGACSLYHLRQSYAGHHPGLARLLNKAFLKQHIGVLVHKLLQIADSLRKVKLALIDSLAGQKSLMEMERIEPSA